MTRRPWLPLALLAGFAAELAAFLAAAHWLGFPATLLLIVVTSLIGAVMVRREGLRAWRAFRDPTTAAHQPGRQLTDGMVGLAGALLLAAPGLVSTLAGAALLVPPVRNLARAGVQASAERRMTAAQAADVFGPRRVRVRHDRPRPDAPVVEGEIVEPASPPRRD